MGHRKRKGCRKCQYKYFQTCCRYCNILELNKDSEILAFIALFEILYKVRKGK
jgi:hypothetical protein